jgi:hypothetical protein
MFCWVRLNTNDDETFSSKVDMIDVMFVNWFTDDEVFDDISNVSCSFNFSILENWKSECNSAENLLEDTDFADDVNESDENDERNCWNNESNNNDEKKIKKFTCEFDCCDVVDKNRRMISLLLFVTLFWWTSFLLKSKFVKIEYDSIEIKRFLLVDAENESINCLVTKLVLVLSRIDSRKSKFRWISSWNDCMLYCWKTIEEALSEYSFENVLSSFALFSCNDEKWFSDE